MTTILKENAAVVEYLKNFTLLCVEDDKDVRDSYESLFGYLVKEIIMGENGQDGYEKFIDNDIDLIITDYSMPKMNGLEMIQKIRDTDKEIPIILITAIDNENTIINALNLRVNNFIKKPVMPEEMLITLIDTTKILIANKHIAEEEIKKNQEIDKLQAKEAYTSYQEELAFAKELNILRNDFYYQMIDTQDICLIDFLYQPLDVMSGDAYSARQIDKYTNFYLVVDGMGKGLSASLTAMIMTTFVNHTVDKMITYNDFNLERLVNESLKYIKPILLEEEALAIDFVTIDIQKEIIAYAKFAMPVILLQNETNEIIRIKSNNSPLCKYSDDVYISTYNIKNISKLLIYSDGLTENETTIDNKLYAEFIEEDFKNSFTKDDFKDSFSKKIKTQEDDITFIYIHKLQYIKSSIETKIFNTSLEDVDNANEWYSNFWNNISDDSALNATVELVFTELFMNAYEHGNLAIDARVKNQMLIDDTYFECLLEKEKTCAKTIEVKIYTLHYNSVKYIITMITDSGNGFDTQILSSIFRNSRTFNGRGVFVSRKNSLGIYYNRKGNSVLFLNKA